MKREIFAGFSLGLLAGLVIGLSIAETTGLILGSITSILSAFLGIRGNKEGKSGNQIIIGTFALTCVMSILFGIFLRTHNFLSPSMSNQIKTYRSAYFDSTEIKKIIMLKEFGVIPSDYTFTKESRNISSNTVLMEDNNLFLCNMITNKSNLEEIVSAYMGSGLIYSEIVETLSKTIRDTTSLKESLLALQNTFCE